MQELLTNIWDKFFPKEFNDDRDKIRVGDTVVAYIKMTLKSKVSKRLTAAQKQALKKELESGKTMEEILESQYKAQPFRGVIIAIKGTGKNKMVTIRKIGVHGVGVERIVPLYSRVLHKLEIIKTGKVRRSKLYYLRNRQGKKAMAVKFRDDRFKARNKKSDVKQSESKKVKKVEEGSSSKKDK